MARRVSRGRWRARGAAVRPRLGRRRRRGAWEGGGSGAGSVVRVGGEEDVGDDEELVCAGLPYATGWKMDNTDSSQLQFAMGLLEIVLCETYGKHCVC